MLRVSFVLAGEVGGEWNCTSLLAGYLIFRFWVGKLRFVEVVVAEPFQFISLSFPALFKLGGAFVWTWTRATEL